GGSAAQYAGRPPGTPTAADRAARLFRDAVITAGDPRDCRWRRRSDGPTGTVDAVAGGAVAGGVVAQPTARTVRGIPGRAELRRPLRRRGVAGDACPGRSASASPSAVRHRARGAQPILGGSAHPAALGRHYRHTSLPFATGD